MNPRVNKVKANDDFTLTLEFTNREKRLFDVKPYLETGVFRELRDLALFKTAKASLGTVQWKNGQDFCPDTLYQKSLKLENSPVK